ncbi:MAG TPA: flagellar hook-basal body complex protein FliE [Bacillota bacterium]|nr:flagellar hook-basal body complex protein FliE [Bacillota bacterium]HOK69761.1 flagellar hook-basal body complex protein FliE [Bacillota bacterium]HPP86154.1 flagellar hook-basal body complex protein FliE [Bacillota bacterium]
MTVTPVNTTEIVNNISTNTVQNTEKSSGSYIPFEDILKEAITNVIETNNAVQMDAIKIAAGDMDSLHQVMIDIAKADLAVQTLVQVRNKALEAYNEIMRITL